MAPPVSHPSAALSTTGSPPSTQVLLIGDRDGPPDSHPALQRWLDRNWSVDRVARRHIDGIGTKLFVVLSR